MEVSRRVTWEELSPEALRRRDREAVAQFFRLYRQRVVRVLVSALGPDPELPDLVQEVFAQALKSFPRFMGDARTLESWITRIALFTARRCIRTRRRRRWIQPASVAEGLDPEDGSAGPSVVSAVQRASASVERLPADERTALILRFVHGCGVQEIASACSVSVATAKRRVARARAELRGQAARDPLLCEWIPTPTSARPLRGTSAGRTTAH